ncbi:Uncharacterised protein [Vibrio cholerae]|nr:Uncharacterised protein [Vibrio cholerae]
MNAFIDVYRYDLRVTHTHALNQRSEFALHSFPAAISVWCVYHQPKDNLVPKVGDKVDRYP